MTNADAALILVQPLGVTLVILIAIWRPWRGDDVVFAPWAPPLVLALAYPVGRAAISGLPSFPAPTADEWLVFASVAAGGWGMVEGRIRRIPGVVRHIVRLGLVAALLWLMVFSHVGLGVYLGLVSTLFLAITALDYGAQAHRGPTTWWALSVAAGASAPILLLGASFRLSLMAATLSVIAAVAAALCTFFKGGRGLEMGPAVFVFSLLLAGLYVSGVRFAMTPLWAAIAIAVALLGPLVIGAKKAPAVQSWTSALLRLAAVVLLCGAAVGIAYYETKIKETSPRDASTTHEQTDDDDPGSQEESNWRDQDPYNW